jgi:hypothetical protein
MEGWWKKMGVTTATVTMTGMTGTIALMRMRGRERTQYMA